jgi:hypothetical protein
MGSIISFSAAEVTDKPPAKTLINKNYRQQELDIAAKND